MWSWDQTNPLNKSLHGISLSPASMLSTRALFILRLSDVVAFLRFAQESGFKN
jgi:hypothetical protein